MGEDDDLAARRQAMVDLQIHARGIRDPALLAAMRQVPRHEFVAASLRGDAYDDTPLPIEERQTISQPYIVALMLAAAADRPERPRPRGRRGLGLRERGREPARRARRRDRAPSAPRRAGARAAGAARLCQRRRSIAATAAPAGPQARPYDAIVVAAAGPRVPEALREQLAAGGRLVMPVGAEHGAQRLVRLVREGDDRFAETDLGAVMFVPLVGAQGWSAGAD